MDYLLICCSFIIYLNIFEHIFRFVYIFCHNEKYVVSIVIIAMIIIIIIINGSN
jgi:hypothetical protein